MKNILLSLGKFRKKYGDFILLGLLSLSIPLFFYKLGQSSLVSWDEAWYAGISHNILKTGDLFYLIYNGELFTDKPPGGMWITAVFFKLFGISSFAAKLSSAISGLLSLYFLYLLGAKLFNRLVGFCAAVSLLSSFWFLYRARSGNLDTLLTLFYILTVYLAVLASKKRKYLIPLALSLGYLALIKGIVFMVILLPAIFIIFLGGFISFFKRLRQTSKLNIIYKIGNCILFLILVFGPFGIWIGLQALKDPVEAAYHFTHSQRNSTLQNNYLESLSLFKQLLHNGIGKWFWPGIIGVVAGLFLNQKRFYLLSIIFVLFSVPFIFSPLVNIWHLIPLYPFMVLGFYGLFYELGNKGLNLKLITIKTSYKSIILTLSLLTFAFYFSFLQLRAAWYQFIDIPAYVSDEEILSKEAGKYACKIYLDEDFEPAAAFYSGRVVQRLSDVNISELFQKKEDFLFITTDWRLERAKLDPSQYKLLKKDRDKVLIQRLLK